MRGTYTLLLEIKRPANFSFGKLGRARVKKGYCLYTGSALGRGAVSLEGRLKRHSRSSKRPKWHVDCLTSHPGCTVKAAICLRSRKRLECVINRAISEMLDASPILPHIGASDCRCDGHLSTIGSLINADKILVQVKTAYSRFGSALLVWAAAESKSVDLHPIFSEKHLGKF